MPYITRTKDHDYICEGVTYPGVTGSLKVLDKSASLMSWAARMTAEAAVRMVGSLPSLIETVGQDGAVKALTARSAWERDKSAALGTEIHHLADLYVKGQPLPELSDLNRQRMAHYIEWWQRSGWKVRVSEALLINQKLGYGGTLDLLCYDADGRTVLADIKTGNGVYRETILQLTAYGMATWAESDGAVYAMPDIDRYAVIHATAEGVREVEISVGSAEREAWKAVLNLSGWVKATKGRR